MDAESAYSIESGSDTKMMMTKEMARNFFMMDKELTGSITEPCHGRLGYRHDTVEPGIVTDVCGFYDGDSGEVGKLGEHVAFFQGREGFRWHG